MDKIRTALKTMCWKLGNRLNEVVLLQAQGIPKHHSVAGGKTIKKIAIKCCQWRNSPEIWETLKVHHSILPLKEEDYTCIYTCTTA